MSERDGFHSEYLDKANRGIIHFKENKELYNTTNKKYITFATLHLSI